MFDTIHNVVYNYIMSTKHRFQMLLPKELWERLKALAQRNRRPIAQETIIAIERHLETEEPKERKS